MSENDLVKELSAAETVDEFIAVAKKAGKDFTLVEAEPLYVRLQQCKSDTAQLDGNTVAHFAKEVFGA